MTITMTVGDLIKQSLKDAGIIGIGQTLSAEDSNDAFIRVNQMLAQWQRQRWLIWHLIDISLVSTGALNYSIGPGGDFNIARPDRLEDGCFLRQLYNSNNNVDTPIMLIESREDYNRIALKTLTSFSQAVFYDAAYPLGTIYFYPVPQANIYEMHLCLKEQLVSFTGLTETINLPPEYLYAIQTNLSKRSLIAYQMPPNADLNAMASESLNIIRGANTQLPTLEMPNNLSMPGRYNIFNDQLY
jgi:hypothetical protein